MKYTSYFLLGLLWLGSSCKKENKPPKEVRYTIYLAGAVSDESSGSDRAVLWTNGQADTLSDQNSSAWGVALNGNDIYVSGSIRETTGEKAVYWKNGILHYLPNTANYSAGPITIDNGNVCIWGRTSSDPVTKQSKVVYWKNDVLTELPAKDSSNLFDLQFVNGDIYYLETERLAAGKTINRYWKNGTAIVLPGEDILATARCFQVNNDDVYVLGVQPHTADNFGKIIIWKNGIPSTISPEGSDYYPRALKIFNNDVYVVAQEAATNTLKCWKNGAPYAYTVPSGFSFFNFYCINDRIYTLGQYSNSDNTHNVAAYTYNGTPYTVGGQNYSVAWDMAIREEK